MDQFRPANADDLTQELTREMRGANQGQSFLALSESADSRTFEVVNLVDGMVLHLPFFKTWRPRDKVHADGVEFTFSGYHAEGPFEWWYPEAHFERLPGGGIAVADTSTYLIRIVSAEGTVDRLIRRPLSPLAITRAIQNGARERERDWFDGLSPGRYRDLIFGAIDEIRFFAEVPVICGMRATWEGGIWLKRCDLDAFGDVATIDVIRSDGSYAGTFADGAVQFPDAIGPDGLVAFIEKDENEATAVRAARVTDPALH